MPTFADLPALALLASYYVRITAAFVVCSLIRRTGVQPRTRFLIWISFLTGSGLYWLVVLIGNVRPLSTLGRAATAPPPALAWPVRLPGWEVPREWSSGVGWALKVLIASYAVGVAFFLLGMAKNRIQLWLLLRRSSPPSPQARAVFDRLCRELRVNGCGLYVLPGLTSPGTACMWRPRILLPELLESYLDTAQLEDVLTHELVHVRHRDYFWTTAAELIRCLVFFHPSIWLACRNLNRERELACDASVLLHRHHRRREYAECLTRLARVRLAEERARSMAVHLAASGSFLALRVRTLLTEKGRGSPWRRGAAMAARVAVLGALAVSWPGLSLLLRYAPLASVAASPPSGHSAGKAHRRGRRRPRVLATRQPTDVPAAIRRLPSSRIDPASFSLSLTAPAPDVANLSTPVKSSLHPEIDSAPKTDAASVASNPASVAPPIYQGPVWSESPVLSRPPAPLAKWGTTAIRVAAAIGRAAVTAGAERQDQEGEHFLTFHLTH